MHNHILERAIDARHADLVRHAYAARQAADGSRGRCVDQPRRLTRYVRRGAAASTAFASLWISKERRQSRRGTPSAASGSSVRRRRYDARMDFKVPAADLLVARREIRRAE
jgi:hypothetical protein